jgi:hypothetical protein
MNRHGWLLLAGTTTLAIAIALAATPNDKHLAEAGGPTLPPDHTIVFDNSGQPLKDLTSQTLRGKLIGDHCEFDLPRFALKLGGGSLVAREASINYGTCTMVVETGTPQADGTQAPSPDGSALDVPAITAGPTSASRSAGAAPLYAYLRAHFQITWLDIINASVTKTNSHVTWAPDGTCVLDGWGGATYWWQNATGWELQWHTEAFFYSPGLGCQRVQTEISSRFHNGAFCAGQDVYNYNNGVIVAGDYSGNIFGWVNSTYVTEPWWCPPLHWNSSLGYE